MFQVIAERMSVPSILSAGDALKTSESMDFRKLEEPGVEAGLLAERARAGCEESFARLVTLFHGRIFNYLMQMTRNAHDAEDLTQVTFVKAYRNLGRFQSTHAFSSWLFTIARRTALNHFRSARPGDELTEEHPDGGDDPAESLARRDDRDAVWLMARRLKPVQFELLWLRYGEGFSIEEAARILRINPITVRVLLHRARNLLAKHLKRNIHVT
jgi:RNA polymerase sigma-70 factor (ECF subfamily)